MASTAEIKSVCCQCLAIVKHRHPNWSLENQEEEARRIHTGYMKEIQTEAGQVNKMKVKLTEAGKKVVDSLEIPEDVKEQWESIWHEGKLILFMTYGMSLKKWDEAGILGRELKPYNELAKHLEKIVIVSYGDIREAEYLNNGSLAKNIVLLYNPRKIPDAVYSLLAPWTLRNDLKQIDYIKNNQMAGSWSAVIAKILSGKRLIIRQGYPWLQTLEENKAPFWKRVLADVTEVISYSAADDIIVTTDRDKKTIIERFDDLEPKIYVISNYIDTDLFKPDPTLRIPKRILYVGRMAHEKNLISLITAVKRLDVELILIGEGEIKRQMIAFASESGVKNVKFLGAMKNEDIVREYQKAEIFILPSKYEGNPKALMEAMACGCIVIGTNVRGIKEIIEDGKSGFLCEQPSTSINAAICRAQFMIENYPKEADAIREKTRETIVSQHSLQSVISKELRILNRTT